MITTAELHRAAEKEGLRFDQVEKDYVILWILSSLAVGLGAGSRWVFKGGTCLRHCYYPGYRFSEDIDFSGNASNENIEESIRIVKSSGSKIEEETGLDIVIKSGQASVGEAQMEIPVQYSRGGPRRQGLPAVKVHLTFDEPILVQPEVRRIEPSYSDLAAFHISAYSKIEIIAEKMRALLQQQEKWPRPRDLYDLWFMLCLKGEKYPRDRLKRIFSIKCRSKQIAENPEALTSERLKEWNRNAWKNQLEPMMKTVPDYDRVWVDWTEKCHGIFKKDRGFA